MHLLFINYLIVILVHKLLGANFYIILFIYNVYFIFIKMNIVNDVVVLNNVNKVVHVFYCQTTII